VEEKENMVFWIGLVSWKKYLLEVLKREFGILTLILGSSGG